MSIQLPLACGASPKKRPQWKDQLCLNHVLNMPLIPNTFCMSVQRELRLFWNIAFIVYNKCFLPEQFFLQHIFYEK